MRLRANLILASQSPRRRRLLEQIGLTFCVQVSPAEEVFPNEGTLAEKVQRVAADKAMPVARQYPDALVLAADTVVSLDDAVLEKPATPDEARAMLQRLSNRTHTVYTGVALVHRSTQRRLTASESTEVTFAPLTDEEIDAYVASGSPMDKAGAYGIQDDYGAVFVSHIQGDYYNVVGLPLHRLYRLLRDQFSDLIAD